MNKTTALDENRIRLFGKYRQCINNTELQVDIVGTISAVVSLAVFIHKYRQKNARKFPNNFASASVLYGSFLAWTLFPNVIFGRRQMKRDATGFYKVVCTFQAICFQMSTCLIAWHWIITIIVLYQLIVKQVSYETIRKHRFKYFFVQGFFVSLSTILMLAFNLHGPVEPIGVCWVDRGSGLRFAFLYCYLLIGIITFCILSPSVVRVLLQTSALETNSSRLMAMKEIIVQHLCYALYVFIAFIWIMLYAMNTFVFELDESTALESNYILDTMYTYCYMNAISVCCYGLIVSIIYAFSYNKFLAFKRMVKRNCCNKSGYKAADDTNDHQFIGGTDSSPESGEQIQGLFLAVATPFSEDQQNIDFCDSHYEKNGRTVVSIPPEQEERQSHLNASNVYTASLLNFVREQLEQDQIEYDESELESYVTSIDDTRPGASDLDRNEEALDLDSRLALAKQRWMETYSKKQYDSV